MENELRFRIERCLKLGRRYYSRDNNEYNLENFIEAEKEIREISEEVYEVFNNFTYPYFNKDITLDQIYQVIDILVGTNLYETKIEKEI